MAPSNFPNSVAYRRKSYKKKDDSELMCRIAKECGACPYVNDEYPEGLDKKFNIGLKFLKDANVLEGTQVVPVERSPLITEYRSIFKLAVRAKQTEFNDDRFAIGLFKPGTHAVTEIDHCPLHTLPLKRFLLTLREVLNQSSIKPYDEKRHDGELRYIVARASHMTGQIMVTFVVTKPIKRELKNVVLRLRTMRQKVVGAFMNINDEKTNAIFGEETKLVVGADRLREALCEVKYEVSPTAFFQVNPWQAGNLYRRVESIAGRPAESEHAWDLYCGSGQISLILAKQGYNVTGIEENEKAIVDAEANAVRNDLQGKTSFIAGRVEDMQDKIPEKALAPKVIVTNPSRRGLAESTRKFLTDVLSKNEQTRLIYVSCEAETLARDLKELVSKGFRVRQIEGFDMFPFTSKMEWIAVVTK